MSIRTKNPATGELIAEYPTMTDAQVRSRLDRTGAAFRQWSRSSFAERSRVAGRIASLIRERSEVLAELITDEMGKPIEQARA